MVGFGYLAPCFRRVGERVVIDTHDLYQRYGPMVLRRCRRLLRHEEDAMDALHDTFVQLLRHRERLDAGRLAGLLQTIATNVCLNRLRTRERRPEHLDHDLLQRIADAEEPQRRLLSRLRLSRLFAEQPASTRAIAVLHLCDGLTLEDVAQLTGLSVSGVRYRLRGLTKQLRLQEEAT